MFSNPPVLVLTSLTGVVTDGNGRDPILLDFYVACERGYAEEVRLYCDCCMPVNEECIGRNNSESLRPLALAAKGGHISVLKILISHHADVNAFDRRGRTALHLAAWKGETAACALLLEHGALVFHGDHQVSDFVIYSYFIIINLQRETLRCISLH